MLYEMLLPPMRTFSEKNTRFEEARVGKLDSSIQGTVYEKMILHCLEVGEFNRTEIQKDPEKRPTVEQAMEYLMMSDNDMSLNKESLNQVIAYINHTEVISVVLYHLEQRISDDCKDSI